MCICVFKCAPMQVRTKTVGQCVEFYYLSKRLLDKQKKQKEESKDGMNEQLKSVRNTRKAALKVTF